MAAPTTRYTIVAIALHWAIALAIIFMIWLGWNMDDNEARFQLHKSIGITILILTIARIVWRLLNPPPPLPDSLTGLEKTASHAVHLGFYALMLAMPLTGWLVVSTSFRFDVPTVLYGAVSWPDIPGLGGLKNDTAHGIIEFVHSKLAWLAIGLLVLHLAGAIKHEIGDEHGVLKRMLPGLFGATTPPSLPSNGALIAFGSAFAVFTIIAGTPWLTSKLSASSGTATEVTLAANWQVDPSSSEIAFSGLHDGNTYSGTFSDWTATINFAPDKLDTARAHVSVMTASARANQKLYTDSLKSAEWLDPANFPEATVDLSQFAQTADGYTATAVLTLKSISLEVPFDFTLDINGDTAVMTGSTVLARTPLDLGMTSDPSGDWVSEEVRVDVTVQATRLEGGQ